MTTPDPTTNQEGDQLAKDLINILTRHDVPLNTHPQEYAELVADLCIYIAERDYKILEHGYAQALERIEAV